MAIEVKLSTVAAPALVAAILLSCIGCGVSGRPRAAVEGTVSINGEPLRQGVVRFIPMAPNTGPKATAVVADGAFQLPVFAGPVVGLNRVEIESTDNGGYAMDDETALSTLKKTRGKIRVLRIPAVYNKRSELTADLQASEINTLQFPLTIKQ